MTSRVNYCVKFHLEKLSKTNLCCDENVNADDVNAKVNENVDDDGNDVDHAKGKSDAQKSLEQTGIKKT
jgi:hypothetical protein